MAVGPGTAAASEGARCSSCQRRRGCCVLLLLLLLVRLLLLLLLLLHLNHRPEGRRLGRLQRRGELHR
jgi:hypothetical protein